MDEVINDKYTVVRKIGQGGTSRVYLVVDTHIGKKWALKIIDKDNDMSVHLARHEIDMLKSIDYPMFPRIVDAWQNENSVYIVSDYIEGARLDEIIGDANISRYQAISWMKQIGQALDYLHSLSPPILYLDLKPENIIVRPDGSLSLIDFGIAGRITNCKLLMGTPGYAAPEQYSRSETLSEKTDIFAFGMTYYAIRMGRSPNADIDIAHLGFKDRRFTYREQSFLYKCTDEDANKRYTSIKSCINQLDNLKKIPQTVEKRIKQLIYVTAVVVLVLGICSVGYFKACRHKQNEETARQILLETDRFIRNGEYTEEGIKLITSFLASGCLDDETQQDMSLEVAMYYFEVQRDYKKAYRYLTKLNELKYPEVSYLMELCQMQMTFDSSTDEMTDCIKKFYASTYAQKPSKRKYENIIFISYCFETAEENSLEGIKKAITVVEAGVDELGRVCMEQNDIQKQDMELLQEKYDSRLEMLYKKVEIESMKRKEEQLI